MDDEHKFLFTNRAYGRWFGPQYQDLAGKHLRDLLGEEGYAKVSPYLKRAFKGETVTFETDINYKVGKRLAVEVTYVPDRQKPEEEVEGVVVLVSDITEKKRMEQLLRASEARFRIFMENSPAISFIKNIQGKFLFVSKALERVLGVSTDEWIHAKNNESPLPHEEIKDFQETDRHIIEGGKAVEVLERLSCKRGNLDLLVVKFPFEDGSGEKFLGGIALDVTERRQAEEALLESETKFRTLANSIPQLTWMADAEGRTYWYNQRWYDYTGLTPEEAEHFGWKEVVHPEQMSLVMESFSEAIAAGREYEESIQLKRKDGEWRWFLSRGVPIRGPDGKIIQWVGSATDITDARKVEEEQKKALESKEQARLAAEAANAAKSAFLANMSHEIRTPLGVMIGFSELLKDDSIDQAERDQYVETIIRNGTVLARLIGDILDLSKVEAGRLDIDRISFSLEAVLSDVMDMFKSVATQKNVDLMLGVDANVPASVVSDPIRLKQILINIIGNAVKFTSEGQVTTYVSIVESADGSSNQKIAFTVTDTGVGISEEKWKPLFDPFYQGDPSTTRSYGGTGLGLALARKLARALGGDVVIERSEAGRGSTFVATIALLRE